MRLLARRLVAVLIAGVLLVVRVLSADTSDKGLFDLTKFGPAALVPGYESDMPGFSDKLSDADIWAVLHTSRAHGRQTSARASKR